MELKSKTTARFVLWILGISALVLTGCNDNNDDVMPAFAIIDVNETSSTHNSAVSPRDFQGMVSAWYFTRTT